MSAMETRVLIVAERIANHDSASDKEQTLEYVEDTYFGELVAGLEEAGFRWALLPHPKKLLDPHNISAGDVVLPLWSGQKSRNRRALVPSICESLGVPYVGADAYAAMMCQDKALAKTFCTMAGLCSPVHVLVPEYRMPADLSPLRFPCVVKPSMEGGSMGISDDCIVFDERSALDRAFDMRRQWKQPILIEEFVPGREVSVCLFGNSKYVRIGGAEVIVDGDPEYFDSHLNGFDLKKAIIRPRKNVSCPEGEIEPFADASISLFRSLGKVDYMRVDGKLKDGLFTVLELTPDAHLGATGGFAVALTDEAHTYAELLQALIELAA